jgi:hypothetical protein
MTAVTTATVVTVGQPTSSTSSSSGGTCSLNARFDVAGQVYGGNSSMSSSSYCNYSPGQTLTVNYDPSNPKQWASDVKTVKIIFKIFFGFGVVLLLSSLVTFLLRLFSILFGWRLLKSGRKLASTLPAGTNFETLKSEIRNNFLKTVFGFGNNTIAGQFMNHMQQPSAVATATLPALEPVVAQPVEPQTVATQPSPAPQTPAASPTLTTNTLPQP